MHVWPGVTPVNIWQTPYELWCLMAESCDSWLKASWGAPGGN